MLCKPAVLCVVARTASATGATQQFRSVLDLVREHGVRLGKTANMPQYI
jgi:hypothetical protein